jgi:hypothetical protein
MAERDREGEEQRLLKRFDRERDNPAVATELVERLRVWMRALLRKRWRAKAYCWDDIESGALMRLVEWRHEGKLKHWEDSLESLAERLIDKEVERERTYQRQTADLREVVAADPELVFSETPDPERAAMARELLRKTLELIEKLPLEHGVVLQALIDEQGEDGSRMEDVLGVSRREAEARLRQARVALLKLAVDVDLADDLKDFFESEG